MLQKGQKKFDEFAWIILAGITFILVATLVFNVSSGGSPVANPKSVSMNLVKGDSQSFIITISGQNNDSLSNVTLSASGSISDWIAFSKNRFDISNSTTARVTVSVPSTAALGAYSGAIKIDAKGGSTAVSLTVTVGTVSSVPLDSRPITLGGAEVKYSIGSETVDAKQGLIVTKGTFSSSKESFSVTMPAQKLAVATSAHLDLFIVESNRKGNLIIDFNGQEVYNKETDIGKIVIPVDISLLNTTNIVSIRTTGPSLFKFWSTAVYKMDKLNTVVNFQDTSAKLKAFQLTEKEVQDFRFFLLQARVKEYGVPQEDLFIRINNQLVYADRLPFVLNMTVGKDILGNRLVVGPNNTVSFNYEKESFVSLDDISVVVYSAR